MQLSHTPAAVSASFDDPNLVSTAGLVPIMRLADDAGLSTLAQNPQVVPPSLGLADAQADLAAYDRLLPVVKRLQQLTRRAEDTQSVLGSDVMALALEGYGLLKVAGRNQALEGLRRDLGGRFARARRAPAPAA